MSSNRRYEIEPPPPALGEVWRLYLYEENPETGERVDMGGGVFPVAAYGSGEEASKQAYADVMRNGENWLGPHLAVGPA